MAAIGLGLVAIGLVAVSPAAIGLVAESPAAIGLGAIGSGRVPIGRIQQQLLLLLVHPWALNPVLANHLDMI